MKQVIILLFLFFTVYNISAQTTAPQAGWYIIQKGAQYSKYEIALTPTITSSDDITTDTTSTVYTGEEEEWSLYASEPIYVMSFENGHYNCVDPNGFFIVVKGMKSLTKAPAGAGVGIITETIELISGESILGNSFAWVISQDVGKGTIKISRSNDETIDIPSKNIFLASALMKKIIPKLEFKTVE